MVQQAAEAVQRAQAAGKQRQIVEVINPINEKANNFLATEAMDYPCSNMKEFETIVGVTKALLQQLTGATAQIKVQRIDEGGIDGDLCAVVTAGDKQAVAVVWPTAEKLKQIKQLAEDKAVQLLLVVQPLWKTEGNLVSELGFGPWRKANEDFLATFERSYQLYEQRIGAPSSVDLRTGTRYASGAVLRVLRSFPGSWTVHVVSADGASQAVGGTANKPTYKEVEGLVDAARKAKMEIFKVAAEATSLDREAGIRSAEEVEVAAAPGSGAFYSPAEVQAMDPKQIRRVLVNLGLPGAGTPVKLQQRCLAVAEAVAAGQSLNDAVEEARKLR
uniref:DUF1995 domain-containing protein n=1 Tax=Tetradesmus obliquus TaxID=3088 RepID=A0A383VL88_TETOB|eukprot:jgi/Sobl393_1/17227/SZX65156.1